MSGWNYVKEDGAWHYFVEGKSACGIFSLKKRVSPRRPHIPDSCGKCLTSAPAESCQRPPPEAE
jgi:hypothetical protein